MSRGTLGEQIREIAGTAPDVVLLVRVASVATHPPGPPLEVEAADSIRSWVVTN